MISTRIFTKKGTSTPSLKDPSNIFYKKPIVGLKHAGDYIVSFEKSQCHGTNLLVMNWEG